MSDVTAVFTWWFVLLLIGIIFFPITSLIFSKFVDKGYAFSKVIGIVISSYLIWLLGSIGVFPFTRITIIILFLSFTLINLWIINNESTRKNLKNTPWKLLFFEEILFLILLAIWSYIKATEPSIRGLEKFMDFGFVNSILRGTFFPPLDMWLTKSPNYNGGYFINYYYFGHFITAFLTKLSGIDSAITYNLMIATLFAFTFILSFSISINFIFFFLSEKVKESIEVISKKISNFKWFKILFWGLIGGYLISLAGNLHTIYIFTSGYPNENPVPPWKLQAGFYPERYWYPNATRFIPYTIHEFPSYSFVVSDLHGHVSDIPIVLLSIALLFSLLLQNQATKNQSQDKESSSQKTRSGIQSFLTEFEQHTSISIWNLTLLGVLLSVMYMTNAWDGLIYMLLSGLVIFFINVKQINRPNITFPNVIYKTFSACLFLVFFFLIASLPFSLNFKPFVSGIGVLCSPSFLQGKSIGPLLFEEGKCQKSPIYMLIILWGFFYYHVAGFFIYVVIPKIRNHLKQKQHQILDLIKEFPTTDIIVLLLIFISTLLLIFPEFFYIKDIYPAHYRANTMFKLGYQAFMMLGLTSLYIIYRLKEINNSRKSLFFIVFNFFSIIFLVLVSIYPYFSVNSYFGNLKTYHGLNGLNWMKLQYPDDYNAVSWLRTNISCTNISARECNNQPVILEANGESYTDYARVSANTGLPTIVGWPVHEWLWRGSYDEAGKRIPEVATIYESKDVNLTKEIIKKYNVEYIFVGSLEREKYPKINEEKFLDLANIVFTSGNTKIYKVKLSI